MALQVAIFEMSLMKLIARNLRIIFIYGSVHILINTVTCECVEKSMNRIKIYGWGHEHERGNKSLFESDKLNAWLLNVST